MVCLLLTGRWFFGGSNGSSPILNVFSISGGMILLKILQLTTRQGLKLI